MAHAEDTAGQHDDVAAQLTKWLAATTDLVRDRSVRPVLFVVRGAIVGLLAGIVALLVVVALVIALMRLFDTAVFPGEVWATDVLFGGILLVAGVFLLRAAGANRSGDVPN